MAAKIIERFIPPPIKGLNFNQVMFEGDTDYAFRLANLICRPEGLSAPMDGEALTDSIPEAVSVFTYRESELFFTGVGGIYAEGSLVPAIALLSPIGWACDVSTAAGHYVIFCTGLGTPPIYDGTTWGTISVTGVTTNDIFQALVYRQRLYFAEKNSQSFWYLGPGAITGAAVEYSCGTIFRKGGSIIAMATFTLDGGFGPDDFLAVYNSSGEIALFSGNDPAAATWSIVGVYYVGRPACGVAFQPKVLLNLGGDLLVFTTNGIVSLTKVSRGESPAKASISLAIDPVLNHITRRSANNYNQLSLLPSQNLLIVNAGTWNADDRQVFFMDLITGGWSTMEGNSIVSGMRMGDLYSWVEKEDSGGIRCYATSFNGQPYQIFSSETTVYPSIAIVQIPFTRFGKLATHRVTDVKPYFYIGRDAIPEDETAPVSDLALTSSPNLGGSPATNNTSTANDNQWGPAAQFYGPWSSNAGQTSLISIAWHTLPEVTSFATSLQLEVAFSLFSPTDRPALKYLGMDIRLQETGSLGS